MSSINDSGENDLHYDDETDIVNLEILCYAILFSFIEYDELNTIFITRAHGFLKVKGKFVIDMDANIAE